jgi:hypothetical protein
MPHLKQHVFRSDLRRTTVTCIYCGAELQEGHLPSDHALESAPDYFDPGDPRWQGRRRTMRTAKEQERMKGTAQEAVAVLEAELDALRIWQSAEDPRGGPGLPDDIWDGMSISIDKIETVLQKANRQLSASRHVGPNSTETEESVHGKQRSKR